MGEMWLGIWISSFIGLFMIGVVIYDYLDRKKRKQEIKMWKYLLVILIALGLMFPIISGLILLILYPFTHVL